LFSQEIKSVHRRELEAKQREVGTLSSRVLLLDSELSVRPQ
jgi:hypothetical protein